MSMSEFGLYEPFKLFDHVLLLLLMAFDCSLTLLLEQFLEKHFNPQDLELGALL